MIPLSAEEDLIRQAQAVADQQATSANQLSRARLIDLTRQSGTVQNFDRLMKRLALRASGRRFSRDEMN